MKHGFTLLELIITVAIFTTIIAIVFHLAAGPDLDHLRSGAARYVALDGGDMESLDCSPDPNKWAQIDCQYLKKVGDNTMTKSLNCEQIGFRTSCYLD